MTSELKQTLRAIIDQDSDLFVKGDKGYVKLNIQEKSVKNDKDTDFKCLACDNYWEGNVSKVSVVYNKDAQKGRICVPCTTEIQDFQKQFPTLVNVMKIVPVKMKDAITEIDATSIGSDVRKSKSLKPVTTVRRRYAQKKWTQEDLDKLKSEADKTPQFDTLVKLKPIINYCLSVKLPAYDNSFDDGLRVYKFDRLDGIIVSNVAGKNLSSINPYMINFFKSSNNRRYQTYLENGWNFTEKQAKQLHLAFTLLRKAKLLDRGILGKVIIHQELK